MSALAVVAFQFEEQMKKTKPGFNLERRPYNEIGYLSAGTQHMWQGYLMKLNENPPEELSDDKRGLRTAYARCRDHADQQAHLINKQHAMLELYKAMGELANEMPNLADKAASLVVVTKGIRESLKTMRGEM